MESTTIDQGTLAPLTDDAGSSRFDAVLASARAGESAAFEALFIRVAAPVHGFLRARGAEDPEGLANEVLLRAFRSIDRFTGGETEFRAWVFTIARNALTDERRRAARRPALEPVSPDDMPERAHLDAEPVALESDRIKALLDELTPEQRDVLLLRVVGDLPVREVAEIVGKSEGAVKVLQHRALQALRRKLALEP